MISATSFSAVLMYDICGTCSSKCGMEQNTRVYNFPIIQTSILLGVKNMNDGHEELIL